MACTLLLYFYNAHRDGSQVEVRGNFYECVQAASKIEEKTDASVSCVDEVRGKKLIPLKKKYDVSNLKIESLG